MSICEKLGMCTGKIRYFNGSEKAFKVHVSRKLSHYTVH